MKICLVVAAATATATLACSSHYTPKTSRRIAIVQESGDVALAKDGVVTSVGPFGGGLVDAVEGNPEAEEHASTFRSSSITGFILNIVGSVATGAGVAMIIVNETGDGAPDDGLRAAGIGTMIGGLALSLTGSIFLATAQPHFFDAINVYNDGVDGGYPPPYGPPPGWGAPGAAPPVYGPVPPVTPDAPVAPVVPAPAAPPPPAPPPEAPPAEGAPPDAPPTPAPAAPPQPGNPTPPAF